MATDRTLLGHCHQPYHSTRQSYFNINWFELICQKSNHTFLGLFNIIGLLILHGFQHLNFGISPINCACVGFVQHQLLTRNFCWDSCSAPFGLRLFLLQLRFCSSFNLHWFCWWLDDGAFCCGTCSAWLGSCLFHWIGVMRTLHLVLSCKCKPLGNARHNIARRLQRQHLWLVGMMEHRHYIGWWTYNNANTNEQNLQLFLASWFYLFGLTIFSPDKQTTDIFVDCDFGCVLAMTRSIMRMICVVCKSDSLSTTHLTPLVIGVPSTKPFCGKNQDKWYQFHCS